MDLIAQLIGRSLIRFSKDVSYQRESYALTMISRDLPVNSEMKRDAEAYLRFLRAERKF